MADVTLIDRNGAESTVTLTSGNANCSYVVVGTPTSQIIYNKAGATTYDYSRTESGVGVAAAGETVGVTLFDADFPLSVDIEFPGQYGGYENKGDVTGSVVIDWNHGNMQRLRLVGNIILSCVNPTVGRRYLLVLEQDDTGSRTVTWPTMRWQDATEPTLTTTAAAIDQVAVTYITTDAGSEYLAAVSQGY